ncbi:MAG TPA: hypothetical protein H9675_03950 [Firmicutes bacterium]|nr:hypothetical protein [Bacillota bacterium]
MERFLKNPNLPEGDVTLVTMSGSIKNLISKVKDLGVSVIETDEFTVLDTPVNSHADMLMHHFGGNKFAAALKLPYLSMLEKEGANIEYINEKLSRIYPYDVLLNFARVGNFVFGRTDIMPFLLRKYYNNNGIKIINVNQGYAKCSTAVVDENSIITADKSIAKAASLVGINVLLISPGNIMLKGYDTGFIGGCCGKIGKQKMIFTGDIYTHPDGFKIADFLLNKNVENISLSKGPLIDIGGILPLKESC